MGFRHLRLAQDAAWKVLGYETRWVRTALGRVRVVEREGAGSLAPIVAIHGLGGCAFDLEGLLAKLRRRTSRVIAFDLPGHGVSDPLPGSFDIAAMRRAVVEMVDDCVATRAHVFGISMGGAIGFELGRTLPDKVASLTLCSPGGAPLAADELAQLRERFRPKSHRDALALVDCILGRPAPIRHPMAVVLRARLADPSIQTILANLQDAEFLTADELGSLRVPLQVIWGRREKLLPPSCLRFLRQHAPEGSVFFEPDHLSHLATYDDAALLDRRLAAFAHRIEAAIRTVPAPTTPLPAAPPRALAA